MTTISRTVGPPAIERGTAGSLPIEQSYIGSLGSVGCFAVIGLLTMPSWIVLERLFLLALSLACIGGIVIAAKWHGVLSPRIETQSLARNKQIH